MTAESAAHNITAMKGRIRGIAAAMAAGETVHPEALDLALAALVAAVRRHDAERQRAYHAKQGIPCAGHGCPVLEVIDHIDPKGTP